MSNKKIGVVLGYIAMLVNNTFSFFLTPLMLLVFGTSEFGVYKLVLSITSYFALADLGLSNAVIRYISEYRTNNDKESESKFVGLVGFIDLIVGGVLLVLGVLFYYFIPQVFKNVAANPNFRFELACNDPNGYATTGIIRKSSNTDFQKHSENIKHTNLGGDDAWATNRFLNI